MTTTVGGIPPEGLPLTVELYWGDQSDRKPLRLPAERSARTGDCDLRLHVPEDERHISAEIVFRFRGRAFEVVQVEAFALAAGEQDRRDHTVRVRAVFRHPHARAVELLLAQHNDPGRACLHFNDLTATTTRWSDAADQKARRYEALHPKGISLEF